MSSYIPSNKIEMLPENLLYVNDEYLVRGIFTTKKDEWFYIFRPFSGLPVDEEKDCVNDIAVFLSSKLKLISGKTYATYSHYNHDEGTWYINFTCVNVAK